jgi:hypothetical protein
VHLKCWSEEWWQPGISGTTIFGKGNCCIEDSTQFLINYLHAMPNERPRQGSVDDKQKSSQFREDKHWSPSGTADQEVWKAPTEPWFKLNTNGNHIKDSGLSGWGVVLTDDRVQSECRHGALSIGAAAFMCWSYCSLEDLNIVAMHTDTQTDLEPWISGPRYQTAVPYTV